MDTPPFIEADLVTFLTAQDGVSAIVGDRVGTKPPRHLDDPWIRITLYDAPPAGGAQSRYHLVAFHVQLDCYSGKDGDEVLANSLAQAVIASLPGMVGFGFDSTVVSGVRIDGGRPVLDPALAPEVDRYMVTATIWAHSS